MTNHIQVFVTKPIGNQKIYLSQLHTSKFILTNGTK
jgi:hypothetical protein